MSYANIAAHDAPPASKQPKPDQGLLNTELPAAPHAADDAAKVNVVASDFKRDPATLTSEAEPFSGVDEGDDDENENGSAKRRRRARKAVDEAEHEAQGLWACAKEHLLRPGVAGGLLGVVNVGLLSGAAYALATTPALRRDARVLSAGGAAFLALAGLEGGAAARYARTPRGQDEAKRARREGAAVYRHTREAVLRPGVLGGLVGLVNAGVLGGAGYAAYAHWDRPRWDRRVVSAVAVGLLGLWSGEGLLAERYREARK
ncbi:hypothetical protein DFH11DRAFT_1877008 [Phellopilus nigrolimitatus]|nr:hypothetical protein DFH11DRAFT_1877008 [Phellopilus nigrolimitatus]